MRITTLRELVLVAKCGRSVKSEWWSSGARYLPAAFVLNMQGHVIMRIIDRGLFLY